MTSISKIIDEIAIHLNIYFDKEETKKFYNVLKEAENKRDEVYELSDEDEHQINKELISGKDIRGQIDRLLTFAEERIDLENFNKIALSVTQLLINYGELEFGYDITEDLMQRVKSEQSFVTAETYLYQSKIAWNQGNWKESNMLCKKSFTLFNKLNHDEGMAKCENMFGTITGEKGDILKARDHFLRGLDYLKYQKSDSLKAMLNSNLGIIASLLQ